LISVNNFIVTFGLRVAQVAGLRHFSLMNFDEQMARYLDAAPSIHPSAFIAPGAVIVGDVTMGEEASVWYGAVLRADINRIRIGPRSNIQDGSVVHLADELGVEVGQYVTCGHSAILHACSIDDEVLVGMGSTVLDGAEIGARSVIGANALVTQGMKIPPGSLVLGSPAKVRRALDLDEQASVRTWAEKYVKLSRAYLARQGGR
jgi:carbonic anhydrase/acetyltransferase-like protein (isoleucine patch superfamily)